MSLPSSPGAGVSPLAPKAVMVVAREPTTLAEYRKLEDMVLSTTGVAPGARIGLVVHMVSGCDSTSTCLSFFGRMYGPYGSFACACRIKW